MHENVYVHSGTTGFHVGRLFVVVVQLSSRSETFGWPKNYRQQYSQSKYNLYIIAYYDHFKYLYCTLCHPERRPMSSSRHLPADKDDCNRNIYPLITTTASLYL